MTDSGYDFYLKKCLLPIAPQKLTVKINNANSKLNKIPNLFIYLLKSFLL